MDRCKHIYIYYSKFARDHYCRCPESGGEEDRNSDGVCMKRDIERVGED